MKITKHIGISMDHARAQLIELASGVIETTFINAEFNFPGNDDSPQKSEKTINNKVRRMELAYYKEIGKAILNYDDVLIFGPTEAKTELFNLLRADHHFDKINIEIKQTDKLTQNQEKSLVIEYFANR
ncbi:MAG: hypothetical protein H7X99_02735 [Saprospiraceae bacterium]|nr:hypothetical protein [Saprospiraceae bacterium]